MENPPERFEIKLAPGALLKNCQNEMILKYNKENFVVEISQDKAHPDTYDIIMEVLDQPSDFEAIIRLEAKYSCQVVGN